MTLSLAQEGHPTGQPGGDTSGFHLGGMHEGLPPLDRTARPLSAHETWRPLLFYAPFFVQWAWLGLRHWGLTLPTVANPRFPIGGLIGESKSGVLETVQNTEARDRIAPYVLQPMPAEADLDVLLRDACERMTKAGLAFPVVAKPDIGSRGAGVRLAKTEDELRAYLAAFPRGEAVMLQSFVPYEAEAGVFYVRMPGEDRGRIFSLTLKYFPYVTGDGRSNLRELIMADPRASQIAHVYLPRHAAHLDQVIPEGQAFRLAFAGSHSRGTIFKDGGAFITPAMTDAFDRVSKAIPEFYFGRFDVRFTTMEDLQEGENFVILEINGAGAEATHVWDSGTPLLQAYRDLARQYDLLYRIGAANRRRGFRPMGLLNLIGAYARELKLTPSYPDTE